MAERRRWDGFIVRIRVHLEWHPGYGMRFHVRRAPRHGDRADNGGEPGTLLACPQCSSTGFLHQPDTPGPIATPEELDA